ncbi:MAG: nicotinate-nucleotide--dimethylbenzimidazole phosphoribosyltransferase [Gammaproteobacteria bacterium]|nr:nicotinate-nucleotide--dimethylbenzimidazole phosphoribosyltransferase [Gammaproteobacteria bacterium]
MTQTVEWLQTSVVASDRRVLQAAELRQASLTKPPGALGRLEEVAIRLAAMQGKERPVVDSVYIVVFAADHGVCAENISAFPQAVTTEMVKNFARGGAAISVLARELDAELEVVNLGTVNDPGVLAGVLNLQLGAGTANFCEQAAMTGLQLEQALDAGRQAVERARQAGSQLFIGGEMGIGNTTSAAALACALLDATPTQLAGPGTGLDAEGVRHKVEVIQRALNGHCPQHSALEYLRCLGGFEIAALAGAYVACAQAGLPVLVDGFISSVAALTATRLCSGLEDWLLFSHASAEPGHQIVLDALAAQPLLDFSMRLGEGSGAAVAVPMLRLACALHNGMATFAEAGVSEQDA